MLQCTKDLWMMAMLAALDPGAVWNEYLRTVVYIDPELDDKQGDRRMAEVVKTAADSVSSMLVWTGDFPSAHQTSRFPILDIHRNLV